MHKEIENTTRLLEHERRRLYLVEEATERVQTEYEEKRSKFKMTQAVSADEARQQANRLRDLEARLDKAIQKLNASNEKNDQLHEEIDKQRKERLALDHVYKKLQKEIKDTRNRIDQNRQWIDEQQQRVLEEKETVGALKKQCTREREDFNHIAAEYFDELQYGETIRKEMAVGGWAEVKTQGGGKGKGKKRGYMVADEEDRFSDQVMYRRILKLAFLNTIQRRHIKQHQKNIEVFEQAFATIKSTTGISEIEEIVKIFVKLEERNFSLLTYVNQLNREIETTERRNRELKQQLDDHRDHEDSTRVKKDQLVSALERQIQKTAQAQEEIEQEIKNKLEVIEAIRPSCLKGSEQLRKSFGPHPVMAFPDRDSSDIGEFLTYIEKMILLYSDAIPADAPMKVIKPPPAKRPHGQLRPQELTQFIAQQSNLEDDEEDEEEGMDRVMPMSRADLKAAAERSIAKRRKGRRPEQRKTVDDPEAREKEEKGQEQSLTFETMVRETDGEARRLSSQQMGDDHDDDVDRKWRKEPAIK
jgi:predicted  nucleic acid-binding Zn-ribbon protein